MGANISPVLFDQIFRLNGPLWWPSITGILVNERVNRPISKLFPSCSEYTTSSFLNAGTPLQVHQVDTGPKSEQLRIRLECLSDQATKHDLLKNHSFANVSEVSHPNTAKTIRDALSLIEQAPTLSSSIGKLARSVHVLHQPDPDFDISFSHPYIPFSIFISVPNGALNAAPRVAEAIIHESMHLQLSLIEHSMPLARTNSARHYSPWKQQTRPVSGIIHALYVFAVIDDWIKSIENVATYENYFEQRKTEIAAEIKHVDFRNCLADATDEGRELISRVMQRFHYR